MACSAENPAARLPPPMPSEPIKKLLILQERDKERIELENLLDAIPRDIAIQRERIEAEEARAREAREAVLKLESRRNALEGELEKHNATIARYRNQQLEVKKNEEYQALDHEIAAVQAKISEVEDEEIQVLVDIDTFKEEAAEAEQRCRENLETLRGRISKLEERENECRSELEGARRSVEEARAEVPADFLEQYDRLARHVRFPLVVALRDKKCEGCHLKVSAGVESDARQGKEIATCDSCNRLLYCE